MSIAQKTGTGRVLHPNDSRLVPSKRDVYFINDLPSELLSRIFEVGPTSGRGSVVGDGSDTTADGQATCNSDAEPRKEPGNEDEDGGYQEESDDGDDFIDGPSDGNPPTPRPSFLFLVSHVCSHWRNVALSTPSLWTTIVVAQEARPPYERESMLLERSKSLPIDIYIGEDTDEGEARPGRDDDFRFLFSMLVPHIHRWRTMKLPVFEYSLMFLFLSAVSNPTIPAASRLTTLELYYHEESSIFERIQYPGLSKHFIVFGASAPLLTRIVLSGVHVDWNQPWIASASNLIDLDLAFHPEGVRPSWAQFTAILRGASSLEKLSLRQSGPSRDPPEWFIKPAPGSPKNLNAPVSLPRVTTFVFEVHSQERAIGLLRKLYLPALKHLRLDFHDGDYTDLVHTLAGPATCLSWAQEQPHSLLSRLESLSITGLRCRPGCAETMYGELQNLKTLSLSGWRIPHRFVDLLCWPRRSPGRGDVGTWVPRLETLYVSGTSWRVLREMVRWRKSMGVPLSSLWVKESCRVVVEDVAWLKKNVKFGFFRESDERSSALA